MSAIVKTPNDIGGDPAGPIDLVDHPKADWEHQVDGLLMLMRPLTTVDELRRQYMECSAASCTTSSVTPSGC